MAKRCKRCKDASMTPGDEGLCIPCRLIEYRKLTERWEALKKAVRPFKLAWLNGVIKDLEEEYAP